jgi:outer membrane protein assembly factor BamB
MRQIPTPIIYLRGAMIKAILFSYFFPLLVTTSFAWQPLLESAEWNQFHGNGPNQGFMPIGTSPAKTPQWTLDIGYTHGNSPVIGPDDTIYVGNSIGELFAINSNGTIRWRREIARGWDIDTVAVDSEGRIYAACTWKGIERDHRGSRETIRFVWKSKLICLSSIGQILWNYEPGQVPLPDGQMAHLFFTSVPKIWENKGEVRVFLIVAFWNTYNQLQQNYLVVINGNGDHEATRYLSKATFVQLSGGGGSRKRIPLGILASGAEIGSAPLPANAPLPNSAIAIVDFGDYKETPLIIASDDADAVTAFRWQDNTLASNIWSRPGSDTTFKYLFNSPAVFYTGVLLLGRSDGQIMLLDTLTGNELYQPWPRLDSAILSTPASFLRQIYLITQNGEFVALDSDGTVWKKTKLEAQSASSPAMSASFLYVNAANGIYTLTLDLEQIAYYEFEGGGTSSPAIGHNGTVYTLGKRTLYAFARE